MFQHFGEQRVHEPVGVVVEDFKHTGVDRFAQLRHYVIASASSGGNLDHIVGMLRPTGNRDQPSQFPCLARQAEPGPGSRLP